MTGAEAPEAGADVGRPLSGGRRSLPSCGFAVSLLLAVGVFGAGVALAADEPSAACSLSRTAIQPGESVTLDATGSTGTDAFRWDRFGDGSFGPTRESATLTVTYEDAGTYEPRVRALDTANDTADAAACGTLTVTDNEPPSVDLSVSPSQPAEGEPVSLAAEAADPDGAVERIVWTVDHERVGSGPTLDYAFERPGRHVVGVAATDDEGATGTATRLVTVVAADGTETPPPETPTPTSTPSPTNTPPPTETATATATPTGDFQPTAGWFHTPLYPDTGEQVSLVATGPTDAGVTYRWDVDADGTFEKQGVSVRAAYAEPGRHEATLEAVGPGGRRTSRSRTVTVLEASSDGGEDGGGDRPFWVSPVDPRPGESVTFVADAPGPSDRVAGYRWDLDGDGQTDRRGRSVTWTVENRTRVTLVTEYADGGVNRSSTTVATAGTPVGDADAREGGSSLVAIPVDPDPGEQVTMVADPAAPSADVAGYRWDLDGDGETDARGRSVTHAYADDGLVAVNLTVELENGSAVSVDDTVAVGNATRTPAATESDDGLPIGAAVAVFAVVVALGLAVLVGRRRMAR